MNNAVRAISVSLILILSSLAGCLTDDETTDTSDDNLDELLNYGTVMVSTYHVGELVSAVAGDSVTIEYMSQDNIPVHDYEPSAADLIRLQEADIFFYHGLNLEPWVESTLSSLGDDAPPSYMTHAMPTGASNLAYESMLISDLCELMNDGPFESTTLGMVSDDHGDDDHDDHGDDDHDDHGDDDHDDHGDDDHDDHGDDDHDDHGDDDHDDHGDDDHDAHEHAEAEMTFENPEACPADTTIQVFHMEAGEHILEFESEHDEDFNMAVLKMLGGHAHHDHHGHGDDDHGDDDDHDDISIVGEWIDEWNSSQVIDSDSWNSNTITHYDNDEMWAVAENGADSWNPGFWSKYDWTWNSEELYYCQSTFAAESEADALSADSANATDLDTGCGGFPWSQMDHAHDDHEDHDEMVCYDMNTHTVNMSLTTESDCQAAGLMWTAANSDSNGDDDHGDDDHGDEMCHNTDTHENYESTEEECESAGHMWTGDDDHDDHHGEGMCHNTETHENYESTEEDCHSSGHVWMGDDEHDLPEIHAELVAHTLSFFEEISIVGEWIDEWNSSQVIDSDSWNSNTITHYDNDEMWAVAENGADSWNPGFWSKYDWTWNSEELYYCQSTFAAESEADALSADSANATDLDTGCGGFPWSQMDHAHDDHEDHDEMVCYDMNTHTVNMSLTTESDCQAAGLMWTAANSGPGGDDHSDEEEHHGMGAVVIHIEAEGDYGFVLPNDIHMYIVMDEGGHDDHDDHDDHGDDDHGDDDHGDDDHDDHGDDGDEIVAGDDEDAFTYDPHSWLSPIAFEAQVNVVLASLSSIFPNGSDTFTENAASYSVQLMDLHERFTAAFGEDGTCDMAGQDKTIVANHNAYSYMSVQYDIDIITLHGLDPEGEPSPADIVEVVESIEEKGITVLFVEEYTDQTAINSIVEQTGVSLEILYTMEMAPSDSSDNYLSMMNKNLENIISGCGC